MFRRVLITNRGEIAVRVIRACRELNIESVAVYSEVDRHSLHVAMADEAILLPDRRDYLNVERLLEVARSVGAEAVHPGYGFLSENPGFSRACGAAGLTFIGPDPEAIHRMGVKTEAREAMREAGVPVLPGTAPLFEPKAALAAAAEIGYPVLVKADRGGGGRGIRVASTPEGLETVFQASGREAAMAFGDGSVYLERYLERPRHVEVQVLCDRHGHAAALGERDCSLQRRRQKLLEEGPSPAVGPELRATLQSAALMAAKAVGYVGAGTVEFLLAPDGQFYFLEMNTRIQVEHPVTELLTGVDLVKEQIRVAAGLPLDLGPQGGKLSGWAIECRIVAEDPAKGFAPSPGMVSDLEVPGGPWVRWDSDLYPGYKVTPFFDSLLGKLITWGRTREEAIARMRRALGELKIAGLTTSLPFMRALLADEDFCAGAVDVQFIERRLPTLLAAMAEGASPWRRSIMPGQ